MVKIDNVYIKKAKKKRMIKKIIISMIFIAICCIIFVTQTSFFNIKEVQCVGDYVVTGEDIIVKTDTLIDDNILFVNKKDIVKNLKDNPYIESVDIKRKLPNKLILDVKEKKGIFYIGEEGNYSIVSDELILLEKIDTIEGRELIELKGIEVSNTEIGAKIEESDRINKILYYFYKMASLLKQQGEEVVITSLDITDFTAIKANIGEVEVRLGNDEDLIKKMNNSINIYKSGLVGSYIDVSFEGSPVIDYKE